MFLSSLTESGDEDARDVLIQDDEIEKDRLFWEGRVIDIFFIKRASFFVISCNRFLFLLFAFAFVFANE